MNDHALHRPESGSPRLPPPARFPLVAHGFLTRVRGRFAPVTTPATKLDHYFMGAPPSLSPLHFAGRLLDGPTLCRLGWWTRGAALAVTQYNPAHLAIEVTYAGCGQPNVEVALRVTGGDLWLELEGVYLFGLKGGGLGPCALWHCAQAAREIGCRHIAVQASRAHTRDEETDIGYYAWPRMGFDGSLRLATLSRLARIAPEAAGCRTVREVLALDKSAWRAVADTMPLRLRLDEAAGDLTHLRDYLAARGLLL